MKSILSLMIATLAFSAQAELVQVSVPTGQNVVKISQTISHSGCSSTTEYLDVVHSQELGFYVASKSLAIKNDDPVKKTDFGLGELPVFTCQAIVQTTTTARFLVHGPAEIAVEMPAAYMDKDWNVSVTEAE